MNMEQTHQVHIKENLTSNQRELMFITQKLKAADTCQEQFSWIQSQALWTQLELDLSVDYSDQTTLCLDNQELETIGLKDIILRVQNSLIKFWILLEKRQKVVIVYKGFRFAILSVEEQDLEWVHF